MEAINLYLESKRLSWSETTMRSERARLHKNINLTMICPDKAFEQLSKKSRPYTVKTTMIRLAEFLAFKGDYTFKEFIKKHPKLFIGAYRKERLSVSYDEAKKRILTIQDAKIRQFCEELLFSGARIAELLSHKRGEVVGKGGRVRELFLQRPDVSYEDLSYETIYRALKAIGLKPHSLRKLAATRMVSLGFKEADLMRVMGWSSMATASSYLQPKNDDEIRRKLLGG